MAEYQQLYDPMTQQISGTVLRSGFCDIFPVMGKLIDLTDRRFGNLVVLGRVKQPTASNAMWLCVCDCGQQKVVRSNSLISGETKSCGCNRMTAARAARTFYTHCTVPGCGRKHAAKGYCHLHYERLGDTGSVEDTFLGRLQKATLEEHFDICREASLWTAGGCLEWGGSRDLNGYGRLRKNGVNYRAHRLAYERTLGPIPTGLEVCHTCDNPPCINPAHLFIGTTLDNAADRERKSRGNHEARQKPFAFVSPSGEVVTGVGLTQFCAEHGLLQPKMSQVLRGSRPHHKGWTRYG